MTNAEIAQNSLAREFKFRIVGEHIEFLTFDEEGKIHIQAVRPIEPWHKTLWDACISYKIKSEQHGQSGGPHVTISTDYGDK